MLSSWTAASARKVASEMKTEREVNPFKMLAEEGVAGVNGFVSSLVEGVEARLDYDDVSELIHSQGLLDRVRPGARKWQLLSVSVDGMRRIMKRQSHVWKPCSLCLASTRKSPFVRTATLGRNPKQSRIPSKDQHPSGSAPHSSRRWLPWLKT